MDSYVVRPKFFSDFKLQTWASIRGAGSYAPPGF